MNVKVCTATFLLLVIGRASARVKMLFHEKVSVDIIGEILLVCKMAVNMVMHL